MLRRPLSITLAVLLTGAAPLLAQQTPTGSIAGRAVDEAKQPYTDYSVQLRDALSGQIVRTVQLDTQGRYSFPTLELSRRFLVELYNTKEKEIVCTEGPIALSPSVTNRPDVNIDCGAAPAALWLLAAGAGAAAAIAVVTVSGSQ